MQCEKVMAALVGGTVDYGFMPRGGGARQQLNGAELAGLLSGLSSVAMDLAYALYAADDDALFMLRLHMQLYAASLAVSDRWDVAGCAESVSRLGVLSVFHLASADVCSVCHGSGVYVGKQCGLCLGIGRLPASGRQRSRFLLVSQNAWQRVWADRYAKVFAYLSGIDASVRHVVSRNSRPCF